MATRYGKKTDMWNWDGSTNYKPHWRTQADVVDDFGTLARYKRCSCCRLWLLANEENFHPVSRRSTGHVSRWLSWCRPCERVRKRETKAARPPEVKRAEYERDYAAIKADPKRLERKRETNRSAAVRWRQTESYREARRRYRERVKADPKRAEARRETERMNYRLRRERAGRPVRDVASENGRAGPEIPVGPLIEAVERLRARRGIEILAGGESNADYMAFCEMLGVSDRTMRDWRDGKRKCARLSTIDQVLQALGWHWWDVYEKPVNGHAEDPEAWKAYRAACLAFEGELVE